MKACKCGSYAINHGSHGRDGSDGGLFDVCYWRTRATSLQSSIDEKDARIAELENSVSIDDFIREIEQCPGMKDKLDDARKWLADRSKPSFASDTLGDGWIRWHGKGYPEFTSNVEIRLRNPDENTNYRFNWIHDGSSGDIIAYRVVG